MSWLAGHPAHSAAPPGWVGAIVVGLAMAIVALAFALCVRYFLYPGEASPSHIKRRILE